MLAKLLKDKGPSQAESKQQDETKQEKPRDINASLPYDETIGIFADPKKIETTMAKSKRTKMAVYHVHHNLNWSAIFDEKLVPNTTGWKFDAQRKKQVEEEKDAWTIEIFGPSECAKLIELCEMYGFEDCGYPKEYRGNTRTITNDPALADKLYQRVKQCCPQKYKADGGVWEICGLNERFRWCKYVKGQQFGIHVDARFVRSAKEKSFYTVNVYLNDGSKDFKGGRTCFFAVGTGKYEMSSSVTASPGLALLFNHYPDGIDHNGEMVSDGVKYLMRTDVVYRLTDEVAKDRWQSGVYPSCTNFKRQSEPMIDNTETDTLLRHDEQAAPSDDNAGNANRSGFEMYSAETTEILQNTIQTIKYLSACVVVGNFSYSSRFSVWYLYADEFSDSSHFDIVWVLYGGFFNICVAGLVYPCLSDSAGYDKSMIIMLLLRTVGIFGECIAFNFVFLSVFFILSQVEITAIALAYIAWILPHKFAIQYTAHLYTLIVVGYLMGPVASGLLSYFVNYRSVFWLNFALNVLVLLMAIKFVLNTQKKLETDQLELADQLNPSRSRLNKDYIFPVIIHANQGNEDEANESKLSLFFKSMSRFQWIQILNVITQNSFMISLEAVFITYYPTFILTYFNGNHLVAYFQLFMICFGFIVGNALLPTLVDAENSRKIMFPLNNKYFLLIASLVINFVLLLLVYPSVQSVHVFWGLNIVYGFFFGLTSMTQEVFILELQPKSHTGKINGIKAFIRHVTPAVAILIAGLMVANGMKYAIFYVAAGCLAASFILALVLLIMHLYHRQKLEVADISQSAKSETPDI